MTSGTTIDGGEPEEQVTARTEEGIKEVDRMRRAKGVSETFWGASRGLLVLLGAAAPFTVGYQLAEKADKSALLPVIVAVTIVVFGAVFYGLIQIIAASRTRMADQAATNRAGAYALLFVLFIGQLAALPAAAYFQGLAVYQTLQNTNSSRELNSELADRIDLYLASKEARSLVDAYCEDHIADNEASTTFLKACVQFDRTPPPKSDETRALAASLRQGSARD